MSKNCDCSNKKSSSSSSSAPATNDDLTHADWLGNMIANKIRMLNPNIVIGVRASKYQKNKGVLINIYEISETDITNLALPTNTDSNNNSLFLDKIAVKLDNNAISYSIPGFKDATVAAFNYYDANAFINGQKSFIPFTQVNTYLDNYTSLIPFLPQTINHIKTYNLTLKVSFD